MNKNLKLAIMLVAASILGSGVTMMATSELQKKGVISDTYLTNKDNNVSADGLVRTASRPVDLSRDFTDVAENTINCVVSIKSYATPQQNYYRPRLRPGTASAPAAAAAKERAAGHGNGLGCNHQC